MTDRDQQDRRALCVRYEPGTGRDAALGTAQRPSWRGRVHLIGLIVALPGLVLLIAAADGVRARTGAIVYALGMCSMLFVSVTYHRWVHDLRARAAWRRADHAMIFAAIAGSSTPLALTVMPGVGGALLLALIWSASITGAGMKVARWRRGDAVGSMFYIAVSCLTSLLLPAVWRHGGVVPAVLFIVGGALYICGAIWFAKQWPRLRPAVFSFHEVWHVCTLLAAAAHFAAVWVIST